MAGLGAKSRIQARRAKAKQASKKAARQTENWVALLPKITEDDLLAFQFNHFGDDSQPANWFVDAETAINCGIEEDDLGYYDDGVKRTLTDEQIAIFRSTELWQLERERMRQDEAEAESDAEPAQAKETEAVLGNSCHHSPDAPARTEEQPTRPFTSRKKQDRRTQDPLSSATARRPWQKNLMPAGESSDSWKQRRYPQMVPYDERHKRKWEDYIEEVDPVEGSLTHRRKARELDDQQHETIEMDY